ncbi:MAG: UDP-N-acetylmuramate dehydrogenase [Spirochaetales bacterium]|nr:UDP-N-acetylmuramate dehydrogenase [Spirochaetales bacterium]
MSEHTWFRIGGPADALVFPEDLGELARLFAAVNAEGIPFFVLGGGANILVSDRGVRGIVIDLSGITGCRVQPDGQRALLSALAGTPVEQACALALREELTGLEFLSGMPGSIGGSVWMNARCYGSSISDVLASVDYLDERGSRHTLARESGQYDYKRSPFQGKRVLIVEAVIALTRGNPEEIRGRMQEHRRDREAKGHFRYPCAGSIFKNDRRFGEPTGQIIDELGMKGLRIGDAQVSELHGNIIVNRGSARAAEVLELIQRIEARVLSARGFQLEREVRLVGQW